MSPMVPSAVARKAHLLALLCAVACVTEPLNPYAGRWVVAPREVSGNQRWSSVSAGFLHTCALNTLGKAYCWGTNRSLQLGVATVPQQCEGEPCSRTPVAVSGNLTFTRVAAFGDGSCGLVADGTIYCWGQAKYVGAKSATPIAIVADSPFVALSAAGCALTASGVVYCWGPNQYGQLGDSSTIGRAEARPVKSSKRFRSVSASWTHACAVSIENEAYCWGRNRYGELGIGEVPNNDFDGPLKTAPTPVSTTVRFTVISAGGDHTCALALDGRAYCWGRNNASQLGDVALPSQRGLPAPVAGDRSYAQISAGQVANCAVEPTGDSWCWGSNYFGGLTDPRVLGDGFPTPLPTRGGPYASVSVGGSHACGTKTDQRLFCWGDKFFGQIGSP